ncbi:esterase-like activity of phytase family protein [Streptomyces sp. P1-3]|uniref:esterase-like activity of phytase family protein n=1 Tax=Streptomyces sp. P1-3 TaxID=3421658 RepID=UPI003D36DFCF
MRMRNGVVAMAVGLVMAATLTGATTAPRGTATRATAWGGARPCSPYVSIQRFSDALDKTEFHGSYVGNLSALVAEDGGRVAALSDRSELFTLGRGHRPESVVPLADEKGGRLDSEGLVAFRGGTYLVSSETEPSVRRYDRDGTLMERLPVPDELLLAPDGRGRVNETFEGLTLSADGRTLIAAMEGPLIDEPTDEQGREVVRFQTWRQDSGGSFALGRQYRYPVDKGLKVPELSSLKDGRLLVLERGYTAGEGNTIRLYLADPGHASATRPMPKALLADLGSCPSLGATHPQPGANPLLDNVEGIAVVGRAPGGRLRLLLVSDDNHSPKQVTRLYELSARLPR